MNLTVIVGHFTKQQHKMVSLSKSDYYSLLSINEIKALSPATVAEDYEYNNREWYHLILNEVDFPLLIAVPNIKWYSICRCHLEADDGSSAHEHMHALINFINRTTKIGLKKKLQRLGKRLNSKTTFKNILCLDHAVGVLRYICCKDGQKPLRRDADGLRGTPHSHYSRTVFDESWLHARGNHCADVRDNISNLASSGVKDLNIYASPRELHDKNSCKCDRGNEGVKKRLEANQKRREFYSTPDGLAIRKKYKEKKQEKDRIIKSLQRMGLDKKASLQRESIIRLLELL